jgi:hypothetical protein
MSTDAVQAEIDALTLLQEAGIILGFTFKGQPSPCFEVDLILEWDEATNGWSEAGKAREAALDKAMNTLEWSFDDFIELPDNDGVERWIYRFHGQAKPVIPGGHYRCVDASGYDGEAWDIQGDSPREAAQSFVDDGDFEPRNRTTWVHVRVQSPDGDEGTYKIEIEPVAPPCTNPAGHLWLDSRRWGSGPGVLIEETCDHCGRAKRMDTGGHDPVDGSPATVVSYEVDADVVEGD